MIGSFALLGRGGGRGRKIGGGIWLDGTRWVACRPVFFLPVRVLSRLFRRLVLEKLDAAHKAAALQFFGKLGSLTNEHASAARTRCRGPRGGGRARGAYRIPTRHRRCANHCQSATVLAPPARTFRNS